MDDEPSIALVELARALTGESAKRVADLLAAGASDSRLEASAGSAPAREAVRRVADLRSVLGDADLALALRSASLAHRSASADEHVSLVWSGPDASGRPMRRTEQALLELVVAARERLLIVSFAVFAVPAVNSALVDAVGRGVELTLVVETPEASEGRVALDPVAQMGGAGRLARTLTWDRAHRPEAPSGTVAALHAKCACADDNLMLLSSANLTPHGLGLNLELGVLIRGGETPRTVRERFGRLHRDGVLVRVRGADASPSPR